MPWIRILTAAALIAAQFPALAPLCAREQSSADAKLTNAAPAQLCDLAAAERQRLSESQNIRVCHQPFATVSILASGALGVRFSRQPTGALLDSIGTRYLIEPSVRARCCVLQV